MLVSWPLMCTIQQISTRIGGVAGHGVAAFGRAFPRQAQESCFFEDNFCINCGDTYLIAMRYD